jgi:integrating conjugative element protein (TIGR03749 family)
MKRAVHCIILWAALIGTAHAVEILRWERIPLAVPLVIGQERIVFVDQNVRVGMPRTLTGKLRVQSTGGALYLLATEEIPPTRLQLKNISSGEIMLVDIAAIAPKATQQTLEPVRIVPGEEHSPRYGQQRLASRPTSGSNPVPREREQSQDLDTEDQSSSRTETPVPVVLTRYAAQMLYAPLRTVEPVAGIRQVNLNRGLNLSTLMPSMPVEATAMGSWRMDGYWVTAIKLRNLSLQELHLDPRDLMGDFTTATFQHPGLGAQGNPSDTTTLYLVTKGRALAESLITGSVGQIDPKGGNRGGAQR